MRRELRSVALVLGMLPMALAHADEIADRRQATEHYKKGEGRLQEEKWEQAAAEFQKAIALQPTFILAHYGLGQSYMGLKRYDEAVRAFSASRDAYYKVSTLRMGDRLRDYDMSQKMLDGYRNLVGVDAKSRTGGGATERMNVLRDLEQVKRLEDGNPEPPAEISLALAGAWFRSGNVAEAEKENKNALKAKPDYGKARNNLAVIYLMTNRIAEGRVEVEKAEKAGFPVNPKLKEELTRRASQAP